VTRASTELTEARRLYVEAAADYHEARARGEAATVLAGLYVDTPEAYARWQEAKLRAAFAGGGR
jgi:hypothetical protein